VLRMAAMRGDGESAASIRVIWDNPLLLCRRAWRVGTHRALQPAYVRWRRDDR